MSSPVSDNKVLYFGGDDGNIYAVDSETGRQIWKRTTSGPAPTVAVDRQFNIGAIFSTPLVMNGVVYFGSTDGNMYAID